MVNSIATVNVEPKHGIEKDGEVAKEVIGFEQSNNQLATLAKEEDPNLSAIIFILPCKQQRRSTKQSRCPVPPLLQFDVTQSRP